MSLAPADELIDTTPLVLIIIAIADAPLRHYFAITLSFSHYCFAITLQYCH